MLELHPLIVMGHFLLSLVALAVAVVVVQGARDLVRGATAEEPIGSAWLALALVPAAAALVVSGTLTAAGPHSGGRRSSASGTSSRPSHPHRCDRDLRHRLPRLAGGPRRGAAARPGRAPARRRRLALLLAQMVVGEIQWREAPPGASSSCT